MNESYVYPIGGLFAECHEVDYEAFRTAARPDPESAHALRSLNNLWWRELLSEGQIEQTLCALSEYLVDGVPAPVAWEAAAACPDVFMNEVLEAPLRLSRQALGPRESFRALETLSSYADIYSCVRSHPHQLTIQEGYALNEIDSLAIRRARLSDVRNPYLRFLREYALPYFEARQPDLVWLIGRPSTAGMAMAAFAKQANPSCHVSIVGHSSEYFSLNKIAEHLLENRQLFSMVDSIVLDDEVSVIPLLRNALAAGDGLEGVPNLLYADRGGIRSTPYETREASQSIQVWSHSGPTSDELAPAVLDARLWVDAHCYWDNCAFCGINSRFRTMPRNSWSHEVERAAQLVERARDGGSEYVWSVDEAIPPANMAIFASEMVRLEAKLQWQARSKIDPRFTDDVCEVLAESGLREIRLGLESINPSVLESMSKYGPGWTTDVVEDVTGRFHKNGISVHFPVIVGFPGESSSDRRETYEFLASIRDRYPSVTFNVNILGFDVASPLYQAFEAHGVTTVRWPTASKYFLGNLVDWDVAETPFNYSQLDVERNSFMRSQLYPWMPEEASLKPFIFYRLTETSRATLIWKSSSDRVEPDLPMIQCSPTLVCMGPYSRGSFESTLSYTLYDWSTHQSIECDDSVFQILEQCTRAVSFEGLVNSSSAPGAMKAILERLLALGFIVHVDAGTAPRALAVADPPRRWRAAGGIAAMPRGRRSQRLRLEPRTRPGGSR